MQIHSRNFCIVKDSSIINTNTTERQPISAFENQGRGPVKGKLRGKKYIKLI